MKNFSLKAEITLVGYEEISANSLEEAKQKLEEKLVEYMGGSPIVTKHIKSVMITKDR